MDKKDKFVSDDGVSHAPTPVTPEGGEVKPRKADKAHPAKKDEKAEETQKEETSVDGEEVVVEADTSIASVLEGMDLSEEFKSKVSVIFEAAVNEQVAIKVAQIEESLVEKFESELQESIETKMDEIVENLDSYLNYVVNEWMEENQVAIESGMKVEMAESLMNGLKDLFTEHNIKVDEETFDIVTNLEEQITELEEKSNDIVNENIKLTKALASMKAERVFDELTGDLTMAQRERMKILSEKLDFDDLDSYTENLQTLKESFFSTETKSSKQEVVSDEEDEILTEEKEAVKPVSEYSSINAIVAALNARR